MCENNVNLCHLLGYEWVDKVWVENSIVYAGYECLLCGKTDAKAAFGDGRFTHIDLHSGYERR